MRLCLTILFLVLFGSNISPAADNQFEEPGIFNKNTYLRHLKFLASDLFEGRGTGTLGAELTAKYIASEFSDIGLTPAGNNGTYYQHIPMHSTKTLDNSRLVIYEKNTFHELKLGTDYLVYKSGEQTFLPNAVEMVFAGYGIIASEYDYNDYQSIDVRGKVVVVLEGEPVSDDLHFFKAGQPTQYAHPESKHILAVSRGAVACIIIPNPISSDYKNWDYIRRNFQFDDITLAYSTTNSLCVIINSAVAETLFNGAEFSIENVYDDIILNKIHSFPLVSKFSFRGFFKRKDFVSANIVGIIKGSDYRLSESYIIVSAHYDHLGIGPAINNDSIYNGLTDNAMGVASLMEIARAIQAMPSPPKRSILFILTTGEEKGLLGSTFYTDNPVVPLYKTIANVNIDGVAFIDKFNSVIPVGAEYSNLGKFLEGVCPANSVYQTVIPPEFIQGESFNFSDQLAFARAGIPSVLVIEGPDYVNYSKADGISKLIDYSQNIYHSPADDFRLDINYNAALQHTKLLYDFILYLAENKEAPDWKPDAPFTIERLRTTAERR